MKKRHYLTETVPAGPTATRDAEKVRTRLVRQVDEHRQPKTKATVSQLLDRYLEVLGVQASTGAVPASHRKAHSTRARPVEGRTIGSH